MCIRDRGQADGRRGQQVDERIGFGWHGEMDCIENRLVLMRASDSENLRMRAGDVFGLRAKAACHDHPAIFGQCLTDGFQRFGLGAVEKLSLIHI